MAQVQPGVLREAILQNKVLVIQNGGSGGSVCSVPTGGATGQVLTKKSNANCDTDWENVPAGSPNLDGGFANSIYGGTSPIDGGNA